MGFLNLNLSLNLSLKYVFYQIFGTAGARFVVMKQLRASGGVWLSVGKTNLYIDPGPGALVRCLNSKPKLEPSTLDGILLTHKHLDHSGDINVMIEAMTDGGFKKRGVLFAPRRRPGRRSGCFEIREGLC